MKAKKILVEFECQVGDYTHNSHYIFDKQMSNWRYCKEFWVIDKKDELKENCFWDNDMMNAISVYSKTEITKEQTEILKELGVA